MHDMTRTTAAIHHIYRKKRIDVKKTIITIQFVDAVAHLHYSLFISALI